MAAQMLAAGVHCPDLDLLTVVFCDLGENNRPISVSMASFFSATVLVSEQVQPPTEVKPYLGVVLPPTRPGLGTEEQTA